MTSNLIPNHPNDLNKVPQSLVTTSRTLIFIFFLLLVIATQRLHMILCRSCHTDHSASISKGQFPALPLIAAKCVPRESWNQQRLSVDSLSPIDKMVPFTALWISEKINRVCNTSVKERDATFGVCIPSSTNQESPFKGPP